MHAKDAAIGLGLWIQQARKAHGLSQRELAARVGVDHTYISKIEAGKLQTAMSEQTADALAATLDLHRETFMIYAGIVDWDVLKRLALCDSNVARQLRKLAGQG